MCYMYLEYSVHVISKGDNEHFSKGDNEHFVGSSLKFVLSTNHVIKLNQNLNILYGHILSV